MASVAVRITEEVIPTYLPAPPDKHPMFLENRVYQGSSGKVYPLPFTDRIAESPVDRAWKAIWLENEYLRVMVLPEIGGRIHVAQDKTNGYDFIYRQTVIKPALVGLAGPWISGGIEFNWPQHHRPATFLPVEYFVEEHADGSRTVWLSDHDPMQPHERHAWRLPASGQSVDRAEGAGSTIARRWCRRFFGGPTWPRGSTRATSRSSRPTSITSPTTPSGP